MDATTATPTPARDLVLATIGEHSASVLNVARRYSLCADDAHDAYQRGLEIFLRRAEDVQPETAAAWLRTVVKHEALAIRAARRRVLTDEGLDPDREEARNLPAAEERFESRERVDRSAEALQRLKPQELRALLLKARGYSYAEIQEITGWTYTKVNRCLTEGRRAFLDRFADIEAGRECERWTPLLSALADGEAASDEVVAARPHLRHCASCRARLLEFRAAPRAVAAVAPALPMAVAAEPGDATSGVLARLYEAVAGGMHERATLATVKLQAAVETLSAGKVAAVAASATALAGGGAAIVERTPAAPLAAAHAEPVVKTTPVPARGEAPVTSPGADAPSAAATSPSPSQPAGAPSPEAPDASATTTRDEFAPDGGGEPVDLPSADPPPSPSPASAPTRSAPPSSSSTRSAPEFVP